MTNANNFQDIDPIIKKTAGHSFLVGPSTLGYLRGIGQTAMDDAPSARSGVDGAKAVIELEIEELKRTDLDVDCLLARRDAEPQANQ